MRSWKKPVAVLPMISMYAFCPVTGLFVTYDMVKTAVLSMKSPMLLPGGVIAKCAPTISARAGDTARAVAVTEMKQARNREMDILFMDLLLSLLVGIVRCDDSYRAACGASLPGIGRWKAAGT